MKLLYVFFYVLFICISNQLVFLYGPGVTPYTAFFIIGADFYIRDKTHEIYGFLFSFYMICIAGLISYFINQSSSMIAVASLTAMISSSVVDLIIYQKLIRHRFMIKSNYSNILSSMTDSIIFPFIAFGFIPVKIVIAQTIAKIIGGYVWSAVIGVIKK